MRKLRIVIIMTLLGMALGCSHWGDDYGVGAKTHVHSAQIINRGHGNVSAHPTFYSALFENNCDAADGHDSVIAPGEMTMVTLSVKCVSTQEVRWTLTVIDANGIPTDFDLSSDPLIACDDSACTIQQSFTDPRGK